MFFLITHYEHREHKTDLMSLINGLLSLFTSPSMILDGKKNTSYYYVVREKKYCTWQLPIALSGFVPMPPWLCNTRLINKKHNSIKSRSGICAGLGPSCFFFPQPVMHTDAQATSKGSFFSYLIVNKWKEIQQTHTWIPFRKVTSNVLLVGLK